MCGLLRIKCPNQSSPFLLPFLDFVLDLVAEHEMYSFMDGYSSYNKCWVDIIFFISVNSSYPMVIIIIIFILKVHCNIL
jgi:hypothetical protein